MSGLTVGIWKRSANKLVLEEHSYKSLAEAIERLAYLRVGYTWNIPNFSFLISGIDENGHEYDAFEWTPGCVVDCCCCVDEDENDGGAASERRMMAGMAHGNQGLADLAGLDISEEFDRPWDCAYDPAWDIG